MRDYITKTYPLVIDFLKYNTQENVDKFIYSEKDTNTAFINATLKMNDEIIDLTDYDSVVLGVKKNDGYKVIDQCTVLDAVNGQVEIPFNLTALSAIGMNQFNIALYKGNSILESPKFYYNVVETMIDGDSVVGDDTYPILIQLLQQVREVSNTVNELEIKVTATNNLIEENERTRLANEENRIAQEVVREQQELARQESIAIMQSVIDDKIVKLDQNEAVRISNENERITSEELRKTQEIAREQSESLRNSAEVLREQAESLRVSQETSRSESEQLRVQEEETRKANESVRDSNETERMVAEEDRNSRFLVMEDKVNKFIRDEAIWEVVEG